MGKKNLILTFFFAAIVILAGFGFPGEILATYYSSGYFTSTNLLSGVSPAPTSIDSFIYNLSARPAGTWASIQFSQDNTNWYDSSGVLNASTTMSTGTDNTIDLSGLTWSGANFYYKVTFTSDGSDTPVLDDITVYYNRSPDTPTSLTQYKSDCSTSIATSSWTSETSVCLKGYINDSDASDQVKLQVEVTTGSFSNTPTATSTDYCTDPCTASTTVTGLSNGSQYKWQARSIDSNYATSSWSQFNSGSVAFGVDTSTPDIVAVDAGPSSGDRASLTSDTWFNYSDTGSDDQISFSWTDPSSASDDTFYYELNTTSSDSISGDETTTLNPYIDDITISEGTSYFHVKPKNGAGAWGTERTFIVKYDKTAPTNVGISSISADSVSQLTITALTATDSGSGLSATPYWFQETSNNPGASSSTNWQTSTDFIDDGLSVNTKYTYQVKARDTAGNESSFSTASSKYTLANAPSSLSLSADSQTQITASWSANSNPSGTEYFCENITAGTDSGWITSLSWASSGLTCGTSYSFKVKARNGDNTETSYTSESSQSTQNCPTTGGGGMPSAWFNPPQAPEGGFKVLINNGAAQTNNPSVKLSLTGGSDTVRMAISNFPDFRDAGQEEYQTAKSWNICQGLDTCPEGQYTVYVKFYASWGTDSGIFSDSIIYGKTAAPLQETINNISEKTQKISEKVGEVAKKIVELFKPKPPEQKPPEVPIEELVPQAAPLAFQGHWQLIPSEPIKTFVLSPLPPEIGELVKKFPQLGQIFKGLGINKITDIPKLETLKLTLPGLTERVGLPTTKIEPGKFSLPIGVPVSQLSPEAKEQIPTGIVFTRTSGGLIDFNIILSVTNKGQIQQKIETLSGKPLQLVVKPDKPVKTVKGYVMFKPKTNSQPTSFKIPLNSLMASLVFANPVFAQDHNPNTIEKKLVLERFEYTDTDGDGIYIANIQTPVVGGDYEIITVMDYQNPDLGQKEIRLITVVDPEGYVYEKTGEKETRIPGAAISLFWLNPETNQYELWPAKKYQQENPQITDITGQYSFLVPMGSYYLKVEAPDYSTYEGNIFQVSQSNGIHFNIELKKKHWWQRILGLRNLIF